MASDEGGYLIPEPLASILVELWNERTPGDIFPKVKAEMTRLGYEWVAGMWKKVDDGG